MRLATVTDGGIKNGYINIKPLDDFWPEACIGDSSRSAAKHMIIEFEGVGRATTDIRTKSLRSTRGEVKKFLAKHKLREGDQVEIIRVAPYEYRIRPKKQR
jgi:hypothetical protein